MAKKAIDKILFMEGFHPFSFKYNLEKAVQNNKEILKDTEMDPTSESIINYSKYFNTYFGEICSALEKNLKKSLLNKETLTKLLIADLNRTELILSEDTHNAQLSGDTLDRNELSNTHIAKPEFQNVTESSWALIDSAIDTTILNLNYLDYVKFGKIEKIENETEQVDVIRGLTIIGSSYNAIKQAYDTIIWKGGTISHNEKSIILNSNPTHLMLENANLTRLSTNIASTVDDFDFSPKKHQHIYKYYHTTRKFQEIKSIDKEGNDLVIKYQSKKKAPTSTFISFTAPLLTYYPFYQSTQIQKFENLSLLDLVNLFCILHDLVIKLPMPNYEDTGVKDLTKFMLFCPSIEKKKLLNYFKNISKYSESQITIFLNLLTRKDKQHNLYRYPIYVENDTFHFALSTIKRANMLYLLDCWLEDGNCDLSDRGYKFEDHITSFLKKSSLNDFAKFELIDQSIFFFRDEENNRIEEEIDLVIKTESTIIIAEVKCITYPLEPIDFYNSYQTIKKAKNQIIRKAKFLEKNWGEFEEKLGPFGKRKIEKIIVVNFPHFAGRIIEGIPIADFYLFLSYFQSGKLTNLKLVRGEKPLYSYKFYYNSVQSFEKNFSTFFKKPIPIHEIISRQDIENYEVTMKGTKPRTLAQRVRYKPRGKE